MMIVAPLSARLVERQGTKRIVTLGLSLVAVGLILLSTIASDSPYPRVIVYFMIMAAGMGMTMAPATEAVMGSLPAAKAGVGSAINDTTRQVGGALGVAVIGSVVTSVYSQRIFDLAGVFGLAPPEQAAGRVVPGWRPTGGDGTRRSGGCVRRRSERQLRRRTLGRAAARRRRDRAGGGRGLAIPPVARDRSPAESRVTVAGGRAVLTGACRRRLVMGGAVGEHPRVPVGLARRESTRRCSKRPCSSPARSACTGCRWTNWRIGRGCPRRPSTAGGRPRKPWCSMPSPTRSDRSIRSTPDRLAVTWWSISPNSAAASRPIGRATCYRT